MIGKLSHKRLIGRDCRKTHSTGRVNEMKSYKSGIHNLGFSFGACLWQHLDQWDMLDLGNVIVCINEDNVWYERADFQLVVLSIADDNDDITLGVKASGGAVQADDTRATSTGNGVRLQA